MATGALPAASRHRNQDLYDELTGLVGPQGIYSVTQDDWRASQFDPNSVSGAMPSQYRQAIWSAVPELEQFKNVNTSNYAEGGPQADTYDMPAVLQYLQDKGYKWQNASDGKRQINGAWLVGPDGKPMLDTFEAHVGGDERFMNAARLAALVVGGSVANAGNAGAQAAPEGLTGWDAAMADAAQSGAITPDMMAGGATAGGGGGGALAGNADKAALLGNAGYGPGMTGAETGVFDSILGSTGNTALANGASDIAGSAGMSWLDTALSTGKSVFGNDWLTTAMSLIGSGVNQMNIEKAAQDQRDWLDQKDTDRRRRQAPGALPAMKTTVYTKGGG